MKQEYWSFQTTGSSRLAANVSCFDLPDPPTTTNQFLSVIRLWRSWPGLIQPTWTIPAVVAGGLFIIWPEKLLRWARLSVYRHAPHGSIGDLPETNDDNSRQHFWALSLSGGSRKYYINWPGLGDGYYLHPHVQWLPVSGFDYGLVLQECSQLEVVNLPGHVELYGCAGDGLGE